MHANGIRVFLFVDPDEQQLDAAHQVGARVVEIHTGRYADASDHKTQRLELARIRRAAEHGAALGLRVNAGMA